jgi:putative transposase
LRRKAHGGFGGRLSGKGPATAGTSPLSRAYPRTVNDQLLVEITGEPDVAGRHYVADLGELNRLFSAWIETQYHRSIHSETGQTPMDRWSVASPVPLPAPETLAEAFLREEHRRVNKTALVFLHGNSYEVDGALVGRKAELVFDPFGLTRIEVRSQGVPMGLAVPHHIGRHSHPKAKPETPTEPSKPSGIDYMQLIADTHHSELASGLNYAALSGACAESAQSSGTPEASKTTTVSEASNEIPGQLDLLTGQEVNPL